MSTKKKLLEAAAGNAGEAVYVEDVFSTYLYTGDGTNPHAITNGVNLADEGGLVWTKARDSSSINNVLVDTEQGTGFLVSNGTQAAAGTSTAYLSFNTNGYSIDNAFNNWNGSTIGDYASWTFRKAPKFFDVVTYTGDGTVGQVVPHNLGVVPGMIITKNVSSTSNWGVHHKSYSFAGGQGDGILDSTAGLVYGFVTATSDTNFTLNASAPTNNLNDEYVAYIFAHDDSDESIIKCGSISTDSIGQFSPINLGFEPQWLLIKRSDSTGDWYMHDVMRGIGAPQVPPKSFAANTSATESSVATVAIGADGIISYGDYQLDSNATYIYMAIRRPMKTPESGTEVFAVDQGDTTSTPSFNSGFVTDFNFYRNVSSGSDFFTSSRLTGNKYLATNSTAAESSSSSFTWDFMDGFREGTLGTTFYAWMWKRAPGFFDVVTYTGNATANRQITHNLNAVPELMLAKTRDAANYWVTYDATNGATNYMVLNTAVASASSIDHWYNTTPTASVVTLGDGNYTNRNNTKQILYLFASVPGISKVGSYTGTGNDLNVDCGFSAGARFILAKRTDSTGDWYVWDSLRGIVAGNDPYLLLNSTAAEVTSTDYIDPLSSGFTVTSSAPAALNASGGTYIFYAIA